MKPKIIYLMLIIISLFVIGCSISDNNEQTLPAIETTSATAPIAETEHTEPTLAPTEAPTLPTEPDLSLNVEPGAYLLRYTDKNTSNYLDYYLFIPENAEINMPMIVFLHGIGEVGHVKMLQDYGIVSVTKDIYGEEFPFLLLLPCTHVESWTAYNVPETLVGLIDHICEQYETDAERIIITGHSLGSIGTWKMISTYGDYFSAAVPVSCGISELLDYEQCAKVPVKAYAGTLGYERNYRAAMDVLVSGINEAGGSAEMIVIEGADHIATITAPYTEELFDWMLSQ